jgi:8-oxo-dGTP pyrophosphatase MutT (NUDIX family)
LAKTKTQKINGKDFNLIGRAYITKQEAGKTKFLAIKRSLETEYEPGAWTIPGGHIDASDKSIKDGIIREVKEERRKQEKINVANKIKKIYEQNPGLSQTIT